MNKSMMGVVWHSRADESEIAIDSLRRPHDLIIRVISTTKHSNNNLDSQLG